MTRRKEAGQVLILAVAGLGILLMGLGWALTSGTSATRSDSGKRRPTARRSRVRPSSLYDPTGAGSGPPQNMTPRQMALRTRPAGPAAPRL